jgi:hypothetical protein
MSIMSGVDAHDKCQAVSQGLWRKVRVNTAPLYNLSLTYRYPVSPKTVTSDDKLIPFRRYTSLLEIDTCIPRHQLYVM